MPNKQADILNEQAILFHNVYVPAFVEKCAELGVPLDSQESLNEALETAALVQVSLNKQSGSVIKHANAQLKRSLGVDVAEKAAVKDQQLKTAAAAASMSPQVRKALLANVLD